MFGTIEELFSVLEREKVFFSLIFEKKDGSIRKTGACRFGVTKHLKGGVPKWNARAHGARVFYSMADKGYRSAYLDKVYAVKYRGVTYVFRPFQMDELVTGPVVDLTGK